MNPIAKHEKLKHGDCCGSHSHRITTSFSQTLNIKFKKLHEDAVLPRYAKDGDAGMDCYAVSEPEFHDTYVGYKLGFAVEIPYGYVGLLFPRSSNSKKDLLLSNSVGVIDSGYRGEVEARFRNVYFIDSIINTIKKMLNRIPLLNIDFEIPIPENRVYNKGDAVCQLIILPYPAVKAEWVDELSETARGSGGFGSTGN